MHDGIATIPTLDERPDQMDMMSFWAGALTGGLAGTVFAQLIQIMGWFASRQKLSICFNESITGCRVEKDQHVYFRVKVQNTGLSTATDVQVLYTIDESEIYNMNWAGLSSDTASIPSKTYRFCDIYCLSLADRELRIETRSDAKKPEFTQKKEIISYVYATSKYSTTAKKRLRLTYSASNSGKTFIS